MRLKRAVNSTVEPESNNTDELLHRLVGRLCIAARGIDTELDPVLVDIRQTLRAGAEPTALQKLLQRLSTAIVRLDARPLETPEPTASDGSEARQLLDHLAVRIEAPAGLQALVSKPDGIAHADALMRVVERLGDAINTHVRTLEGDKQELERLLQSVTNQLGAIGSFIVHEVSDRSKSQQDRHLLDHRVRGEIRDLDEQIQEIEDPIELRRSARHRFDAINSHLSDYKNSEEARELSAEERAQHMKARIETLERHAEQMQRSLLHEHQLALTDALTDIPNRLAYEQRIEQDMARWRQSQRPLVLVLWDIDHFKLVNDTYGHRAGDRVLKVVAQRLSKNIRASDFVARYGGEEFVMLLEGAELQGAQSFADNIRENLVTLGLHFRGTPVPVTVSCGITEFVAGDTSVTAFERADRLLYEAKRKGRNRCEAGRG